MEQTNRAIKGYKLILAILLSIFSYGLLFFIVKFNIGSIRVKPAYTYIYIPLFYWLALIIYTYLYSVITKISFSVLFLNMLVIGIFLEIYFMLLGLNQILLFKIDYTRMYLYYAFMIETGLFVISNYFLCQALFSRDSFISRKGYCAVDVAKNIYSYSPFVISVFYQLYRDIAHINTGYFCFHLATLLLVLAIFKRKFKFPQAVKGKIVNFLKEEKIVITLTFLFSLFIRAIFALHIIRVTGSRFPTASDDGITYNELAALIMKNVGSIFRGQTIMPMEYDPGYSIFLGFIYKIFGQNFHAAALIQSLLNALMTVLVYLIAKEIFNRKVGVIAAILTAVNQPLIMLSVVFSIYCLLKFSKNPRKNSINLWLFAGGITMGLAIITRAMLLLFPGLVIFWLRVYKRGLKWIKSCIIFVIGLALGLSLVVIATYTNTGELKLFTTKQDINWIAYTEKKGQVYTDPRHVYSNAKLIEMGINPFKDFKGSLQIVLNNPLKVLETESEILPTRLKLFLFYPNFGYFDPIFILSSTTPNQYASTLEFYALLIFTIGLVNVLVKRGMVFKSNLIFLLIIYFLFIHVVLTTGQCGRYRVPLHPFFMIFAANGLYVLCKNVILKASILTTGKKC
jgi:hypothetical protein